MNIGQMLARQKAEQERRDLLRVIREMDDARRGLDESRRNRERAERTNDQ